MNKILCVTLLFTTALFSDATLEKAKHIELLNKKGMSVVAAEEVDGGIQMVVGYDEGHPRKRFFDAFLTKSGNTVILGSAYDVKTGLKNRIKFNPSDFQISINDAKYKKDIAFTVGNGSKEYYVFTDPMCPFCAKFENRVALDDDVKIHYFFLPLTSLHPDSVAISRWVMDHKKNERHEALRSYMIDRDMSYKEHNASKEAIESVARMQAIAKELEINGTPMVFDANGLSVSDWPRVIGKASVSARKKLAPIPLGSKAKKPIVKQKAPELPKVKEQIHKASVGLPHNLTGEKEQIAYLRNNVRGVAIGEDNNKSIVAFVNPMDSNFRNDFSSFDFSKFLSNNSVVFYPSGNPLVATYILAPNDNKERIKRLKEIAWGGSVPETFKKKLRDAKGEDVFSDPLKISFVVDKLKMKLPSFYDSRFSKMDWR